ncbi:hypothetical protein XPA_005209 [Xanthoria parietina]
MLGETMHKYSSVAARQQAWYSSPGDGSFDYNANPFGKKRKPSVYPEPDADEGSKPTDSENFVAELVRRGTRKLTFTKPEKTDVKPSTNIETTLSPLQPVDEENPAEDPRKDQPPEDQKSKLITWKQGVFRLKHQWRSRLARLGLGSRWVVRHAIADIATSTIAFAPLSVSGQYILPATPRSRQTVVIEYDRDIMCLVNGRVKKPRFCIFPSQTEHQHDKCRRFTGLSALTEETVVRADSTGLRVIYVQDDDAACEQLILDYHIHSPAFSRSRTSFREWIHGEEADHLSVWQTALWRPSYDRAGNVFRAAFGLQYLVPQLQSVSILESIGRFSKKSRLKAVVESSNEDVHDNSLQRLSVYLQLPRDPDPEEDSTESSSEAYNSAIRSMTDQGKQKAGKTKLARERTVVILDSRLKAIATAPLIAGEEPWQQLLEDLDGHDSQSGRLALAVVGLAFEAVAARWCHYILCMHNYIASLEERVYENPADDSRTSALWSVSKQLLQAERLLKFHILLLENIQNDFGGLLQAVPLPPDWLRLNLDEFKRLSSEVEETLKKPTAHMVDLMYKSISIRDARQSLQLNTSLWRISWLTFFFLPLTFLSSFFGMK